MTRNLPISCLSHTLIKYQNTSQFNMGKAEFGTPKYIANKMKAKGLQKLKFYCQVCSKQCRDANGFKAHILSPSHNRNIQELGTSKREVQLKIEDFSYSFELDFLKLLRIAHGTKKVNANKFYQEYIGNDRDHIHLNATRYKSLASFVFHLADEGKIELVKDKVTESDEAEQERLALSGYEENQNDEYNMQNFMIKLPDEKTANNEKKSMIKSGKEEKSDEQIKMEMIEKKMKQDREALERKSREDAQAKESTSTSTSTSSDQTSTTLPVQPAGPIRFSLKKNNSQLAKQSIKQRRVALGFKVEKLKKRT